MLLQYENMEEEERRMMEKRFCVRKLVRWWRRQRMMMVGKKAIRAAVKRKIVLKLRIKHQTALKLQAWWRGRLQRSAVQWLVSQMFFPMFDLENGLYYYNTFTTESQVSQVNSTALHCSAFLFNNRLTYFRVFPNSLSLLIC